jgi:hypothetical protein
MNPNQFNTPAILEMHDGITVVRDDLLSDGGSKIRFLPHLIDGAEEIVFGGPFCGGAPLAIAVICAQTKQRVTLFYAARKKLHWRQQRAIDLGATVHWVAPFGYISHVQADAKKYAHEKGALFLPLGFDVPAAQAPYVEAMQNVRKRTGDVDEVWCACASGMLTRCLAIAFKHSEIMAVTVGLASRHKQQNFPPNVRLIASGYKELAKESRADCPFSCCQNYERKAWEHAVKRAKRGSALFWNVAGDRPLP